MYGNKTSQKITASHNAAVGLSETNSRTTYRVFIKQVIAYRDEYGDTTAATSGAARLRRRFRARKRRVDEVVASRYVEETQHIYRRKRQQARRMSELRRSLNYFARFAPYLERACLRLATPAVSNAPRMM